MSVCVSRSVNVRKTHGTKAMYLPPRTGQLVIHLESTFVHELRNREGLTVSTRNFTRQKHESILLPAHVLQDPSLCRRHVWESFSHSTQTQLQHKLRNAIDFDQLVRTIASNVGSCNGYLLVVELEVLTLIVTHHNNGGGDDGTKFLDEQATDGTMTTSSVSCQRGLGPVEKM